MSTDADVGFKMYRVTVDQLKWYKVTVARVRDFRETCLVMARLDQADVADERMSIERVQACLGPT